MVLNAIALEVVIMDYSDIDYNEAQFYDYEPHPPGCSCSCEGY